MSYQISASFKQHIADLILLSECNDIVAKKSLACLSLLSDGWRYGDPDPSDSPPDGGGEEHPNVIFFNSLRRRAA